MWTKEHETKARAEGWALSTVFDNGSTNSYLMVITCGPFKSHRHAADFVLRRAKENSTFHQLAIRELMASRVNQRKRAKR